MKVVAVLGLVVVAQGLFALCLVSAQQLLVPRNMPFGVAGPIVLLVYLVVAGLILGVLDWRHTEPGVPGDATEAAAMAVPIGASP